MVLVVLWIICFNIILNNSHYNCVHLWRIIQVKEYVTSFLFNKTKKYFNFEVPVTFFILFLLIQKTMSWNFFTSLINLNENLVFYGTTKKFWYPLNRAISIYLNHGGNSSILIFARKNITIYKFMKILLPLLEHVITFELNKITLENGSSICGYPTLTKIKLPSNRANVSIFLDASKITKTDLYVKEYTIEGSDLPFPSICIYCIQKTIIDEDGDDGSYLLRFDTGRDALTRVVSKSNT
jgi:hypothetical protein